MEKNLWRKTTFGCWLPVHASLVFPTNSSIKLVWVQFVCCSTTDANISDFLNQLFVVRRELPHQIKSERLVGSVALRGFRVLIHLRVHTRTQTHHHCMASLYEPITVTDLCLLVLCHRGRHTAWLPQQVLHFVKRKKEGRLRHKPTQRSTT